LPPISIPCHKNYTWHWFSPLFPPKLDNSLSFLSPSPGFLFSSGPKMQHWTKPFFSSARRCAVELPFLEPSFRRNFFFFEGVEGREGIPFSRWQADIAIRKLFFRPLFLGSERGKRPLPPRPNTRKKIPPHFSPPPFQLSQIARTTSGDSPFSAIARLPPFFTLSFIVFLNLRRPAQAPLFAPRRKNSGGPPFLASSPEFRDRNPPGNKKRNLSLSSPLFSRLSSLALFLSDRGIGPRRSFSSGEVDS